MALFCLAFTLESLFLPYCLMPWMKCNVTAGLASVDFIRTFACDGKRKLPYISNVQTELIEVQIDKLDLVSEESSHSHMNGSSSRYKAWGALLGQELAEKGIIVACIWTGTFLTVIW